VKASPFRLEPAVWKVSRKQANKVVKERAKEASKQAKRQARQRKTEVHRTSQQVATTPLIHK